MLIDKNETISDAPVCLCNVVLNTKKTLPTLRYNRASNMYQLYCKTCGFKTNERDNKQSVITDWFYSNRAGDRHIRECWITRYNTQNGTAITLMGTCPQSRS